MQNERDSSLWTKFEYSRDYGFTINGLRYHEQKVAIQNFPPSDKFKMLILSTILLLTSFKVGQYYLQQWATVNQIQHAYKAASCNNNYKRIAP